MSALDDAIADSYTATPSHRKKVLKDNVKKLILNLIGDDLKDFAEGDSEWQDAINASKVEMRLKVRML